MVYTRQQGSLFALVLLGALFVAAASMQANAQLLPTFTSTGSLFDNWFGLGADISGDGRYAIGTASVTGSGTPYRFSVANGIQQLAGGSPTINSTIAAKSNRDGSVVIGTTGNGAVVFRWTESGGFQTIGVGGTAPSGVSSSGDVVAFAGNGGTTLWTPSGAATVPGIFPRALSNDGRVIAGSANANGRAAYWSAATGVVEFGGTNDSVRDVSGDGQFIAGLRDGAQPFRWSAAHGFDLLPPLAGSGAPYQHFVSNISADGSVILGTAAGSDGNVPFVWTPWLGTRSVPSFFQEAGVSLSGIEFVEGTGLSDDGRTLGGTYLQGGTRPVGFMITLPSIPGPGVGAIVLIGAFAITRRRR